MNKVEYDITERELAETLTMFRYFADRRGHDMAFITTAQGAVLTIIGKDLLNMSLADFLLSIIA